MLVIAGVAQADSVRINDVAGTNEAHVKLGDVAELEGDYAQSMRGLVIASFRENATKMTVNLDTIKAAMSREQANWGRLSLQGYNACVVYRTPTDPEPSVSDTSPVLTNVVDEIGLNTAVTIRELMVEQIEHLTGIDRVDLRVTFRSGDEKLLNQSIFSDRVEITPTTSAKLGRLELDIHRYDGVTVIERASITLDVERRYMGLVATRTIKRGEPFAADDVEMRELWLDHAQAPLTDSGLVLGQTASQLFRPGSIVTADAIEMPTLVRRNELITVRCHSGGLVIRTVARAKEDGAMNDTIQVINEKTREAFVVTVVSRREGMVVLSPEVSP